MWSTRTPSTRPSAASRRMVAWVQPVHLGVLLADPDELVDGEEAAVVEVDRGPAPVDQLVVLLGQPVGARGQREAVLVVGDPAAAHPDLVGDLVEGAAEHRQADLAAAGLPVDVEHPGRLGVLAVPQRLDPPGALVRGGHVVGDQVDDQAHAAGPEGGHQLPQAGLAAQLGGDLGRVDHVVAVGRAAPGPQDRRGVQVRDAQVGQVGHDRLGGRERERPGKLHPVGGLVACHRRNSLAGGRHGRALRG